MSSSTSIQANRTPESPQRCHERSPLLSIFHRHQGTQTDEITQAEPHKNFYESLLPYVQRHMPQPAVQDHARASWSLDRFRNKSHPYHEKAADHLRLSAISFSAEAVTGLLGLAAVMDALSPHGSTITNPDGKRNDLLAFTYLLGTYIGLSVLAPAVAVHLYAAMLCGCKHVSEKLHHHSISTRFFGFVCAIAAMTGGIIGAVAMKRSINDASHAHIPEHGWAPTIYDKALLLALVASIPALTASSWYLGRIGSAAVRRA